MSKRRSGAKVANRMSAADVKALAKGSAIGWREWEKKIEQALRMNGWTFWRDRVMPKSYGDRAQRVGRKAGLPDFIAYKHQPNGEGRFILIEAKTGRAEPTDKQQGWIDAANKTPGAIRGYVAYPESYDKLIEILGGERGI